jgi:type II secretory pathway component PulM
MIDQMAAWWRARTGRERILLQTCAAVAFGLVLPLSLFQASDTYRKRSAAALESAQAIATDVKKVAASGAQAQTPVPENDGSMRGVAFAAAQAHGLTVARAEAIAADRLRLAFAPARSLLMYQWFETVTRRGYFISKSTMTRAGDGDLVSGEFEIAKSQ